MVILLPGYLFDRYLRSYCLADMGNTKVNEVMLLLPSWASEAGFWTNMLLRSSIVEAVGKECSTAEDTFWHQRSALPCLPDKAFPMQMPVLERWNKQSYPDLNWTKMMNTDRESTELWSFASLVPGSELLYVFSAREFWWAAWKLGSCSWKASSLIKRGSCNKTLTNWNQHTQPQTLYV